MIGQRRAAGAAGPHFSAQQFLQMCRAARFSRPNFLGLGQRTANLFEKIGHAIQQRGMQHAAMGDDLLAAGGQCELATVNQPRVKIAGAGKNVRQRQPAQTQIVDREFERVAGRLRIAGQIFVAEHHAFGFAGRAGGVKNCRQVVGLRAIQSFLKQFSRRISTDAAKQFGEWFDRLPRDPHIQRFVGIKLKTLRQRNACGGQLFGLGL